MSARVDGSVARAVAFGRLKNHATVFQVKRLVIRTCAAARDVDRSADLHAEQIHRAVIEVGRARGWNGADERLFTVRADRGSPRILRRVSDLGARFDVDEFEVRDILGIVLDHHRVTVVCDRDDLGIRSARHARARDGKPADGTPHDAVRASLELDVDHGFAVIVRQRVGGVGDGLDGSLRTTNGTSERFVHAGVTVLVEKNSSGRLSPARGEQDENQSAIHAIRYSARRHSRARCDARSANESMTS